MSPEEFKDLKFGDMVMNTVTGDLHVVRDNTKLMPTDPAEWKRVGRVPVVTKPELNLDDVIDPAVLAAIPRQPQVQCSVDAQLTVAYLVLSRLGLYDAADVVMAHKQRAAHRDKIASGDVT